MIIVTLGSTKTTCTFDATAVGSCNLVQYSAELPPIYQNFDQVPGVDLKNIAQVSFYLLLTYFKGVLNLRQFGNFYGIHIIPFYKCKVKRFRIVQGTCWMRSRMDLIKLGGHP